MIGVEIDGSPNRPRVQARPTDRAQHTPEARTRLPHLGPLGLTGPRTSRSQRTTAVTTGPASALPTSRIRTSAAGRHHHPALSDTEEVTGHAVDRRAGPFDLAIVAEMWTTVEPRPARVAAAGCPRWLRRASRPMKVPQLARWARGDPECTWWHPDPALGVGPGCRVATQRHPRISLHVPFGGAPCRRENGAGCPPTPSRSWSLEAVD
jgi:hypothetical protein